MGFFSRIFKAVKKVAKFALPIAAIAAPFLAPALLGASALGTFAAGGALGASSVGAGFAGLGASIGAGSLGVGTLGSSLAAGMAGGGFFSNAMSAMKTVNAFSSIGGLLKGAPKVPQAAGAAVRTQGASGADAMKKAEEVARAKRLALMQGGLQAGQLTGAQGVQGAANTARKTLLGQ
jgi:hypothetical protein